MDDGWVFESSRAIPPELLTMVFEYCLPDKFWIVPSSKTAPLLVSQICRAWRVLAISTPSLWSSLSVRSKSSLELLQLWISRSCDSTLSISVDNSDDIAGREPHLHFKKIVELICSHSQRWKRARLWVLGSSLTFVLKSLRQPAPYLESVDIDVNDSSSDDTERLGRFLCSSSQLRSLTCRGNDYFRPIDVIKIPWCQLTTLTMKAGLLTSDTLDILAQAHNLERATFDSIIGLIPPRPYSIRLPHLTYLSLATHEFAILLDHLELPALHEIKFNSFASSSWVQSSFLALLSRSKCALKKLHFHFVNLRETELIECLEQTRDSLDELTVQSYGYSRPAGSLFFQRMTFVGGEARTCLAPKLRTIALYDCRDCSKGDFASMVSSRLEVPLESSVERIKCVEIFDDDEEKSLLKDMRRLGLVVHVYSSKTREVVEEP